MYKFAVISLIFLIGMSSCSKEPEIVMMEGIHLIEDTIAVRGNEILEYGPGTELIFGPSGMLEVLGGLHILGTEDDPVKLKGDPSVISQRIISMVQTSKDLRIEYAIIEDGLINSWAEENSFYKVTFINNKSLEEFDALARIWEGETHFSECTGISNNTGEGLLIHNVKQPVVENCYFEGVRDAVELLSCKDGVIDRNIFRDMEDDAIDNNDCIGTMITNNEFFNVGHRAMELGSDGFGPSKNLIIDNNLIAYCRRGVNIKDGSTGTVTNTTLYNNIVAFEIITDATNQENSRVSVSKSVIVAPWNGVPDKLEGSSQISISKTISNKPTFDENGTLVTDISFADVEEEDFTIVNAQYPEGLDAKSIGYQRKK